MSVDVKDIIYRIVQYLETTNYKAKLLKVCTTTHNNKTLENKIEIGLKDIEDIELGWLVDIGGGSNSTRIKIEIEERT